MSYLKKEFGQNLKLLRKARNITQEKLAEMVDLNQRQLTRIENGISFVSSEVLEKLVIALDIDIHELFDFQLKTVLYEKSGTDNLPRFKIIKENNVIYIKNEISKEQTTFSPENIVADAPNKFLLNIAKQLNKPVTAQNIKNGILEKTYIYYPDGEIKLIENKIENSKANNIDKLFAKIKKISDNQNKMEFVDLAIESLHNKQALEELKMLIKGIEITL